MDVAYATRIQRERLIDEAVDGYTPEFRVDHAFLDACCGTDTVLMHPLPRDSTPSANDLSTDLDKDPRLAIFRQSDSGVAVRMAIFATLLGVEQQLQGPLPDVTWRSPRRIGPDDVAFYTLDAIVFPQKTGAFQALVPHGPRHPSQSPRRQKARVA